MHHKFYLLTFLSLSVLAFSGAVNLYRSPSYLTSTLSINFSSVSDLNTFSSEELYDFYIFTTPGQLTYYNQNDPRWKDFLYGGTDPMSVYGCGPTVMAMLVNSFTQHPCTPDKMAEWSATHGFWVKNAGSSHELIQAAGTAFGLKINSMTDYSIESIYETLNSGKLLVALMGPGHFTDGGHFILLTSAPSPDTVLIADPNCPENCSVTWDISIILDELKYGASGGGPLWSVSIL